MNCNSDSTSLHIKKIASRLPVHQNSNLNKNVGSYLVANKRHWNNKYANVPSKVDSNYGNLTAAAIAPKISAKPPTMAKTASKSTKISQNGLQNVLGRSSSRNPSMARSLSNSTSNSPRLSASSLTSMTRNTSKKPIQMTRTKSNTAPMPKKPEKFDAKAFQQKNPKSNVATNTLPKNEISASENIPNRKKPTDKIATQGQISSQPVPRIMRQKSEKQSPKISSETSNFTAIVAKLHAEAEKYTQNALEIKTKIEPQFDTPNIESEIDNNQLQDSFIVAEKTPATPEISCILENKADIISKDQGEIPSYPASNIETSNDTMDKKSCHDVPSNIPKLPENTSELDVSPSNSVPENLEEKTETILQVSSNDIIDDAVIHDFVDSNLIEVKDLSQKHFENVAVTIEDSAIVSPTNSASSDVKTIPNLSFEGNVSDIVINSRPEACETEVEIRSDIIAHVTPDFESFNDIGPAKSFAGLSEADSIRQNPEESVTPDPHSCVDELHNGASEQKIILDLSVDVVSEQGPILNNSTESLNEANLQEFSSSLEVSEELSVNVKTSPKIQNSRLSQGHDKSIPPLPPMSHDMQRFKRVSGPNLKHEKLKDDPILILGSDLSGVDLNEAATVQEMKTADSVVTTVSSKGLNVDIFDADIIEATRQLGRKNSNVSETDKQTPFLPEKDNFLSSDDGSESKIGTASSSLRVSGISNRTLKDSAVGSSVPDISDTPKIEYEYFADINAINVPPKETIQEKPSIPKFKIEIPNNQPKGIFSSLRDFFEKKPSEKIGKDVAEPASKLQERMMMKSPTLPVNEKLRSYSLRPTLTRSSIPQHSKLSDYKILKTIGTGSFGRVHLSRHKSGEIAALKVLCKKNVRELNQIEHTKSEKEILKSISGNCPFIVDLYSSFSDSKYLYLVLEYIQGGELFTYLRGVDKLSNNHAMFYASQVVMALEYLHESGIVYRDLKPENLLICANGYLKITDFGFAKRLNFNDVTYTLCGTPDYLAPEIIEAAKDGSNSGYGVAVDWWGLGILIYEMIAGHPPFFDDDDAALYDKILACKLAFPPQMELLAKDLLRKLLTVDPVKRYGSRGAGEIKLHGWFKLDWEEVWYMKMLPQYIPKLNGKIDTRYFEEYEEDYDYSSYDYGNVGDEFIDF